MASLLSKIKYQWNDLSFNLAIFPLNVVIKYYWYSYVISKKLIDVTLKPHDLKSQEFTIRCRNGVDRQVLHYVFFQKFHFTNSPFLIKQNPVILDLGANIGCTIVDFKLRCPGSVVFGYEMDEDNYKLALKNCHSLIDVHLFNKAVWINNGVIRYNNCDNTDSYSIQSEKNDSYIEVECISISSILADNNIVKVDYLKMDIEGAEVNILNESDTSWLKVVSSFNIEFHNINEVELQSYMKLLSSKGFKVWKSQQHWSALEGVRGT